MERVIILFFGTFMLLGTTQGKDSGETSGDEPVGIRIDEETGATYTIRESDVCQDNMVDVLARVICGRSFGRVPILTVKDEERIVVDTVWSTDIYWKRVLANTSEDPVDSILYEWDWDTTLFEDDTISPFKNIFNLLKPLPYG
ncbi:hypothetical protein GF338_12420 [candidate division WOR-3 bacterium]|nr:hypothetical protein [candidate division WOR-3 bacterium]